MTATAEVRFAADGKTTVKSYLRLTGSTHIQCCTYPDHAPILTIYDGEVTDDDVTFARILADAVNQYAAEMEKHAARAAEAAPDGAAGQAA
jgi:hypothetical protein